MFSFQGKSMRWHHWFKLNIDWVIENLKIIEPEFYKSLFQEHVTGQVDKEQPIFSVPIDNKNNTYDVEYLFYAPNVVFQQKTKKLL